MNASLHRGVQICTMVQPPHEIQVTRTTLTSKVRGVLVACFFGSWKPADNAKTVNKIGQGHPKVMIYINCVKLLSLMLHAKFQNHRPSGSREDFERFFAIYSHGSHLGHVTLTI